MAPHFQYDRLDHFLRCGSTMALVADPFTRRGRQYNASKRQLETKRGKRATGFKNTEYIYTDGTMMEDFSDLALPPLFGGHILEAELETEGVEFVDGGGVSDSQVEEESQERERRESERERDRRKYCNLSRRCREIEQVNERTLNRLHQVQKLSRQLKKERRFLMKTLNSYGDDYRSAQLTFLLEEELSGTADPAHREEGEGPEEAAGSSPSALLQSASSNKRKRHRAAKEKEAQLEGEMSSHSETHVSGYCSGSSPAERTPSDFP